MWAQGVRDLTVRPSGNVGGLDLLRTLAIVLVFSGHVAAEIAASARVQRFPFIYFGWTGVDLFFVLSGYLIGFQLWKELRKTRTIRIRTFLLRRGLRIWPLYFSVVLLLVVESTVFHRARSGLWADATFLSNYFHHQVGGGWSLSTEEQFYIILPVLLVLFSRFWDASKLVWMPAVALVTLPLVRWLTIHHSGLSSTAVRDWMYTPIHTHSDGLAAGVLIAWVAVFKPHLMASTKFRLGASVGLLLGGAAFYLLNRDIFNYTSLALIFGGFTLFSLGLDNGLPLLDWRGFYVVSRLSYGIYLNHFGLLPIAVAFFKKCPQLGGASFLPLYAASFLACFVFAGITFVCIEAPFLRLRQNWMGSSKTGNLAPLKPLVKAASASR